MTVLLPAWLSSASDEIRRLADRPWTLFCLLLAANALARPCSVTAHDARLYSLQALNYAEQGAYGDDVFLRYGSQDQFTLFSRVVGPMVAVLGLRLAFFVLYVVFNTLFIAALFRLIRALVEDRSISTLALVYLVAAPLNYGGHDIFTVHEQFFTPRLIGTTFTLFALERLLAQRFGMALALLVAGALMHPLMAFGGILIWAGYLACTYLPTRVFVGLVVAGAIGGAAIVSIPAIGVRVFGSIDDDWHQIIRIAVGYNYPDTWTLKDWINLAVSFALPLAACFSLYHDDPQRQRFFWIVMLAGAVGFLATLAASFLPYALPFQGQPYRVLWILKVFQVPLGFLLIARWGQSSVLLDRIVALALLAFFCVTHGIAQELLIFALALPISIVISMATEESSPRVWWWYAIARGLVFGAIGWMAYRSFYFVMQRDVIAQHFDLNEIVLFDLVSPIFLLAMLCLTVRQLNASAIRWAAMGIAFVTPIGLFAAEGSSDYRRDHTRLGGDFAFVRTFLDERRGEQAKVPTVYSSLGRTDLIWIDLHATSYFGIMQTAGVMFNRDTAEEIQRRIVLVNKFEMHRQRGTGPFMDDTKKIGMENLFKVPFDCSEPTRDDLMKLCQEPGLDFVVVPHEFPGLYSATNGRIFVYECHKVNSASSFSARVAQRGR